jgi:lysophospholipase L1-like esterase
MKSLVLKALLVVSSILAIFFFGEIGLRLYFYLNPRPIYVEKKLGWRAMENYRREGFLRDAGGQEYYAKVTTDSHGFRLFGNPCSEKVKILVIGDSFTHAIDVSDDKTYYGLIAGRLKNAEIFAYGALGYGSLQEYMILDEIVDKIRPRIVILQLCFNDFFDNDYHLEKNTYNSGMTRPYMDFQGNISYQNPADWPYVISSLIPYSQLVRFITAKIRGVWEKISNTGALRIEIESTIKPHAGFKQSSAVTKQIMAKIKNRASASIIIAFSANEKEPYLSEFKQISMEEEFQFIDGIPEAVQAYGRQGLITRAADKDHWNEFGHKIVADKIYDYLIGKGYVQTGRP